MQRIHLTNYKKNTHRHTHSHSLGLGLSGCWCLPLTLTSSSTSRLSSALPKWADSRWSSWLSHLSSPSFPRPNNRGAMQHPPHLHSPSISLKTSLILRTVVRNFYFLSVCYLDSFLPIVFPFSFFLYSNASFFCLHKKFHTSGSLTQCNSTSSLANFPVAGNHSPLRCACVWAISPTPASDITPERWGGACRCASACSCKDRPTSSRLKIEPEEPVWSAVTTHTDTHTW